jgi:hypothetical protein
MPEYDALPPTIRAQALVGLFLQGWSAMESALHNAIGAALEIETIRLWILCANLRFRDKTHILRTLVDVSQFPDTEKDEAKKKLHDLGERALHRNMVAHDPFEPDANGDGVIFHSVKAKGKYQTPDTKWSVQTFTEQDRTSEGYANFLDGLAERFRQIPLTIPNYAGVLRRFLDFQEEGWPEPMQRNTPLALQDSQAHQPQAHTDNDPPTSQTSPQTPDSPQK